MGRRADKRAIYDSDAFYEGILRLAQNGLSNKQIAMGLEDVEGVGFPLDDCTFSSMATGNYRGWTKAENERRSKRIKEALNRGRGKINARMRVAYMQVALGRTKTKSKTIAHLKVKCDCGNDPLCPICGGVGFVTSQHKMVVQETESELAPNVQAIANWLAMYDNDWRKADGGSTEEVTGETTQGIKPSDWITKMTLDNDGNIEAQKDTGSE